MDTRSKILKAAGVFAGAVGSGAPGPASDPIARSRPITLVTGYFDVLRAAHVEALEAVCRPGHALLVVLRHSPSAVLPVRARAELVAALRMVDYVVTADDGELDALISSLKPAQIVRLEDGDRVRASELKQHVQRRQSC